MPNTVRDALSRVTDVGRASPIAVTAETIADLGESATRLTDRMIAKGRAFASRVKGKPERTEDIRLPMPPGGRRDPKLGKPSKLDQIQDGMDRIRGLGRPSSRRSRR